MAAQASPARRAALHLLWQVLGDHRLLSEIDPDSRLDPADRARAGRLATQTLRNLPRLDKVLDAHLRKSPPAQVRAILRLCAYELCTGGAAHGIVNDGVALAASGGRKTAPLKGLVNAVLRKVADTGPEAFARTPTPKIANWLRGPLVDAWGRKTVAAIEAVQAETPPVDLTPKPGATALPDGLVLPTGSLRLAAPGQISALPGFETGDWWVQDAAAALPARILDARPGMRVLDMCAAPGGKTLQMAAAGADVTALDVSGSRLARVSENLARTGLTARIVEADALTFEAPAFDAILLDAPCSATGTIRRHPDLPHAKDGSEFLALFDLQARMLDRAAALLKPGGRLVFCTCSLLPDEGEVQADEAIARLGLVPDPSALDVPGVEDGWRTGASGLRLRPDIWADRGGMDGFYIGAFRAPA